MSDARDPAIKIFGRPNPLSDPDRIPDLVDEEKDICSGLTNTEVKDPMPDISESDLGEPSSPSALNNAKKDNHQTSTHDDKVTTDSKPEQDQSESAASGQDKVLKKPDKILPCPRCNSLNTKFCYFNNYNLNQPRHFCKNCQRYWTAGGIIRNVPAGAGRRKTKHSVQHQTLLGGLSVPVRPLKGNEAVMKFCPETPLCESMATVLNLGDQKRNSEMDSAAGDDNGVEPSSADSAAPNSVETELLEPEVNKEQTGFGGCYSGLTPMHHLLYFPGPPWPYPWGPGWSNVAAMAASHCSSQNSNTNPVPWGTPAMLAAPDFYPPTLPFPIVPASFWACISSWPSGACNVPLGESNNGSSPFSSTASNSMSSGSNFPPTLGKHSRDGCLQGEEKIEKKYLWIPKTLRIDDPDEAAKSSIWSTLGIKPDESIKRGSLFRGFQSDNDRNNNASNATQVLHANPAALSRSQTFQEST